MMKSIIRIALVTGFVLLVPLLAMQFSSGVAWGPGDFLHAGALVAGAGLMYELMASRSGSFAYRAGAGIGLGAAFLLIWANVAGGIVGSEDNPINAIYFGVPAVGIIGAAIARLAPRGMARAMLATALAQALAGIVALATVWGSPWEALADVLLINGFFALLFTGSALLFRRASG
jgi:hypothetical protein